MVAQVTRIIALALSLVACGNSPTQTCPLGAFPKGAYCVSAIVLALREASTVHIEQEAVNEVYSDLKRAWLAYPQLRSTSASDHLESIPNRVDVTSSYAPLVDAWSIGMVRTGTADVDAVFADNGAMSVSKVSTQTFDVVFAEPLNMRALAPLAASLPGTMLDDQEVSAHGTDITLTATADGTNADFMLSWGDCMIQCAGTHHFLVWIPHQGSVQLVSESGDAVPQAVLDQAAAMPPPD